MEAQPGLLLNDTAFARVSEQNKPAFIYDWLRSLDRRLSQSTKTEVKAVQQALIDQLMAQVSHGVGPPSRKLLGRCLAKIFTTGDSIALYTVLNSCNDILKIRDDGPASINKRLTTLNCLGVIYRSLGRLCGRSFEETVGILTKMMKQVESQTRYEILTTLRKIVTGFGGTEASCFRDIYKVAKSYINDRVTAVRLAAVLCLNSLAKYHIRFFTGDLDGVMSMCIKGLDGSNQAVRVEIAKLLGLVLAKTQLESPNAGASGNTNQTAVNTTTGSVLSNQNLTGGRSKCVSLDDIFNLLSSAFLRGPGRFHKGPTNVGREIRAGITYSYWEFFNQMGSNWLVANSCTVISHCLSLLIPPPRNALTTSSSSATPSEAAFTRLCVGGHLLPRLLRLHFSEAAQIAVTRYLLHLTSVFHQHKGNNLSGLKSQLSGLGRGLRSVSSTGQLEDFQSSGNQNEEGGAGSSSFGIVPDDPNYLICCLDVLTEVIKWLDSTVAPIFSTSTHLDALFDACLCRPSLSVRVAAAAVLRQLAIALPSQRVPLMDRCMDALNDSYTAATTASPELISGYSLALGGLVAGTLLSDLGIPCAKGKAVFSLAENLLRSANQNSRLTTARTQAGWYLLGACMTLGPTAVRPQLPRLILLWRNAFPRSTRELETEKQRGDAFTWQVTLEARAGALCSIQAFLQYCAPAMVKENVVRRLLPLLECALGFLGVMPDIVKAFGSHLAAPAALLRLRLYRCLALLPPTTYSGGFNILLRELVAEFTLTDSSATTAVCLASLLGQSEDSVVLNSWCQNSDQQIIEDAIEQHSYCCPGSLANDTAYLFLKEGLITTVSSDAFTVEYSQNLILESQPEASSMSPRRQVTTRLHSLVDDFPVSTDHPLHGHLNSHRHRQGPPVLASQVIEASVDLFGLVFPFVSIRHRIQMLEHFAECIRVSKAAKQEVIQVNVLAALLCAWRHLSETKYAFGDDKSLRSTAVALTMGALSSSSPVLRFAAAECVGRLAQVIGEAAFLAEVAKTSFDQLRCLRDSQARAAGLCATIGCLHRFVGGLACGQHLSTSVSVLLAVAQDSSAPTVQAWALNALALTAESGGPMFREFVQPSLNLVLRLLLKTPSTVTDIHSSLANLLGALITTLGPDLQSSSGVGEGKSNTGISCLLCCSILLEHPDPLLQAEGIANFQRIHVFAPNLVNLGLFAPILYTSMTSGCFTLRRASIACIRQISQKDADNLCDVMAAVGVAAAAAPSTLSTSSMSSSAFIGSVPGEILGSSSIISRTPGSTDSAKFDMVPPLEAVLFRLLDIETDPRLRGHLEEAISSLLQARGLSHFQQWMRSLKQLLQLTSSNFNAAEGGSGLDEGLRRSKVYRGSTEKPTSDVHKDEDEADEDDDEQTFGRVTESHGDAEHSSGAVAILNFPPRWQTRILAIACLRRLMCLCRQAADVAASNKTNLSPEIGLRNPQFTREDLYLLLPSQSNQQHAHFDLALARKLRRGLSDMPWLVLHLGDLVRVTFIAATSNSDQLRRFGLFALKQIIQSFATVTDPDSTGNYLLEQFQAQISAALRPAFTTTSALTTSVPPPDITAAACEVCACWLTSGVTSEAADLRRVHDLLTASLEILRDATAATTCTSTSLFSEACVTRLKLAVLTAWAEVFIAASRYRETALQNLQLLSMLESHGPEGSSSGGDGLADIVQQQLLLMLTGSRSSSTGIGSWVQSSVKDSSKLLEVMEQDVDEENESEEEDIQDAQDILKRKRFIRTTRRTVKEARQSYQLLSRLIGPDLVELASDWLAALRDFALINLPDELAFQRPTTSGAFYDIQTGIDAVRPFYARSWLPLLEAGTLCLNTEVKGSSKTTSYSAHERTEKHTVIPMTRDSFFLIFGIAMEAVSDVISKPPSSVVAKCLRVIELLLLNSASQPHIFSSTPRLPVELLSVLHRIILTRDSISLHLACLRILHLLLAAADDRLKTALVAELNPLGHRTNETESEAVSVWLETGQSLEELLSVLVCPSASVLEAVLKALELADGGSRSCFNENPDSTCQLTLTTLQVIVCLLARYHPSVLQSPIDQSTPTQSLPTFPKSVAAQNRKAPIVLASAIHAFTALLKIASPEILTTNPGKQFSGVLAVMCRLVSRIAQLELLKSSHSSIVASKTTPLESLEENYGLSDTASLGSTSITSTTVTKTASGPPNLGAISANVFKTFATAETDITSTSSGANDTVYSATSTAAEAASFNMGMSGYTSFISKLGWSQEQACLADALVSFLAAVAQHHCRLTQIGYAVTNRKANDGVSEDINTTENDDSAVSSSNNLTPTNNLNSSSVAVTTSGDTPPCEWHQLVIACILTFIQHDHVDETQTQPSSEGKVADPLKRISRCCLAASWLSARVVAVSPLIVFRCRAVEFGVFEALSRAWMNASDTSGSPLPSAPLCGATTRTVCLAAIEMLVNHSDADVSSCCVKTLMPQVFHWLYELSVASAPTSGVLLPSSMFGEAQPALSCQQFQRFLLVSLEEAVSAAISLALNVVDIAEASGRQNLLVILLPLFCDLLHESESEAEADYGMAAVRQMLHRLALKNLLALGSRYPAEFRHVVAKVSSLKPRIEAAVKAAGMSKNASATSSSMEQHQQRQPGAAIALKIEFSDFI